VTPGDVAAWRRSFETRLARLATELRRQLGTVPPPAVADAIAVLEGIDALPRLAPTAAETAGAGVELIRLHGDYHLGQTLRTDGGYVVMDFEGEPSRPLAERRAHGCALRDVAGMLRSFDYAEATAAVGTRTDAPAARTPLRDAFLAAYFDRVAGAGFVPTSTETARRWTAFFEVDKALYEIEYELHHRPDWIWIPLRGARQLIETHLS
jgi:maltose alpha-D-glucosyltransferase/alpha-amylase